MYPNDALLDLVTDRRRALLAAAEADRRCRLVARGEGRSVALVRRMVGAGLVRAGLAVSGNPGEPSVVGRVGVADALPRPLSP